MFLTKLKGIFMQYYFTAFIVIFFFACYGYCYFIVQFTKDKGDQALLYGLLFGLMGFMGFCAAAVPVLHLIFDRAV
ncbi:MAG: hypothetical protein RLZZ338_1125 [Cyanobacteriota bacterium]